MSDEPSTTDTTVTEPAVEEPAWTPPSTISTTPPPPPDSTGAVPTPKVGISLSNPLGLALGVLAIVGVVLGLVLTASGITLWDQMGWTWAVLAITSAVVAALATIPELLPLPTAWVVQAGKVAAGILVGWWVLFVLPFVETNAGFLATIGVLAAAGVAWTTTRANPDA